MGSSKKQTVGYQYFLGMHQILCHGPCDNMTRYSVDERTAWQGLATGGTVNVYAASLFGGEGREGGISGAFDLEMGGPTQGPNDYLAAQLGGTVPSFRGVVGVVQRQMYLGNNPYLKKNSWRMQRIFVRQDGIEQWNRDQAGIGSLWTRPQAIYIALDLSGSMDTMTSNGQTRLTNARNAIGQLLDYIAELKLNSGQQVNIMGVAWGATAETQQYSDASPSNIESLKTWFNGRTTQGYTDFRVAVAGAPAFFSAAPSTANRIVLFLTDGEPTAVSGTTQEIAEQAAATLFAIPNVQSFAYSIDLPDVTYTAQMDNTPQDGVPVVTGSNPDALFASLAASLGGTLDMNPAHIIRECLTDPIWGMGYNEADIDDDSFEAAAQALWGEGMGISLLWDRQMPMEQFVQEIIKHINATLYVGRRGTAAGKFVLKLIRADYDAELLPKFDESNIEKMEGFKRVEIGELTNSVSVNYWNSVTGKTASTTAQDPALVQQQGAVINTTMQYPGFTNEVIANRVALRDLQSLSTPLASCTIYTNTDAKDLNIGDAIAVSWEDYGLIDLPMRITAMTLGDGKSHKIKMVLTQDTFALPEQGVIVPPDIGWEDPSQEPIPVARQSAEELPYFELVQQLTQSVVDAQLATEPDTGFVGAAAARPQTGAINARFVTDSGAGYEDVGVIDFSPSALLDGAIGKMEDTLELKNTTDLSDEVVGTYAKINDEYVYITARAGTTLTVKRGVLDTVPHEHGNESLILFADAFLQADPTEYVASDIVDTKLLTVAGQGTLDPTQATAMTTEMDSRAVRPYPPGNMQIAGEYFPDEVVGTADIEVTFSTRNRTLQTAPELVGFLDGDVTAEPGTDYVAEAYQAGTPTLIWTDDTAASPLIIPADALIAAPEVDFRLYSRRDGYLSYQYQSATFSTGGVVVPWDPSQIPNLVAWYDGDSTDNTVVSGLMDTLYDRSGNGNHAPKYLADTANRAQLYPAAVNGLRTWGYDTTARKAWFSSTNAHVKAAGRLAPGLSVFTVSAAIVPANVGVGGTVANLTTGAADSNTRVQVVRGFLAQNTFYAGGRRLDSNSNVSVSDNVDYGLGWHIAGGVNNYLASTARIYVDGTMVNENLSFQGVGYTSDTDSRFFHVGHAAGVNAHLGQIGEVVLCRGAIEDSDRQKLEGYLAHRWGLAALLPGGHPYKAAAPLVELVDGIMPPVITAPRAITVTA